MPSKLFSNATFKIMVILSTKINGQFQIEHFCSTIFTINTLWQNAFQNVSYTLGKIITLL